MIPESASSLVYEFEKCRRKREPNWTGARWGDTLQWSQQAFVCLLFYLFVSHFHCATSCQILWTRLGTSSSSFHFILFRFFAKFSYTQLSLLFRLRLLVSANYLVHSGASNESLPNQTRPDQTRTGQNSAEPASGARWRQYDTAFRLPDSLARAEGKSAAGLKVGVIIYWHSTLMSETEEPNDSVETEVERRKLTLVLGKSTLVMAQNWDHWAPESG